MSLRQTDIPKSPRPPQQKEKYLSLAVFLFYVIIELVKGENMGTKKTIGFYFYNPNRPAWAINLGGILQGLSFFFGLCGLGAFGMGFSFPPAFIGFAVFAALTIACQLGGRRLALGKKQKPEDKK